MSKAEIIKLLKCDGMSETQIKKGISYGKAAFKGVNISTETLLMLIASQRGIPLKSSETPLSVISTPKTKYLEPYISNKKTFLRIKSKEFKNNPSHYEKKFLALKDNFNQKFIFQYPVIIDDNSEKGYIIDFYFPTAKIAVEIDGEHHLGTFVKDLKRDYKLLIYNNIIVKRLKLNDDSNIEFLINKINNLVNSKRKQELMKNRLKKSFKLLECRYLGFNT